MTRRFVPMRRESGRLHQLHPVPLCEAAPPVKPGGSLPLVPTAWSRARLEVLLNLLFALMSGARGRRRIWVVRRSGRRKLFVGLACDHGVYRARRSRFSHLDAYAWVLRAQPARAGASDAATRRPRILRASYGTPSRHMA